MSDKPISANPVVQSFSRMYPMMRYAFGTTLIMLAALGLDYTLSYMTPVLAVNFFVPGAKPPTLKSAFSFLVVVAIATFTGVMFSRFFLDYPLVFLPLLILILFHIYYIESFQQVKLWFIISLLVIPMITLESDQLGKTVALNLFLNALLAISLVLTVYYIFPDHGIVSDQKKNEATVPLTDHQRFVSSGKKVVVIMPVLLLFFIFSLTDALLILIFVTLLSMNPAFTSKKAGIALIIANLGGGFAAIAAFNLLTIVTEIYFAGLLTLLIGLIFGERLFSNRPLSSLFATAYSAFLLILGNVTSTAGEAGEIVWTRILQLTVVVVYLVIAFFIVNNLIPDKNCKAA
jgi:hypothetical protein